MRVFFRLAFYLGVMLYSITSCAAPIFNSTQPIASPAPIDTPMPTPTQSSKTQVGFLEGKVTVGPLRPVERVDVPTPPIPPEVFTSRSIDIFQADGKTRVINVKFNADGTYRVELVPGTYLVALARSGIDRASGLPKQIVIEGGKTVQLNIDIDTGIR